MFQRFGTKFSSDVQVFDVSMASFLPLESAFEVFKELLAKHCVQRPPWR